MVTATRIITYGYVRDKQNTKCSSKSQRDGSFGDVRAKNVTYKLCSETPTFVTEKLKKMELDLAGFPYIREKRYRPVSVEEV